MPKVTSCLVFIGLLAYSYGLNLKCASGFQYYIPPVAGNWFQATEYCNSIGMRLAVITNAQENDNVIAFVEADSRNIPVVWIGGNDYGEEGEFYWQPTGVKFSYTSWSSGQPDNAGGNENCVETKSAYGWKWNDAKCHLVQHFVCENVDSKKVVVLF
ncbi:perlucin-like [Wyeomyia smithii]|uniref:perlucin-like n=1 Tax=Wyeomyia smithii TaxID=174621 RepID=UPI00246812D0|nr:perlucin-like [Wyeomyia smithii]